MSKRISELDPAGTLVGTEQAPLVQVGAPDTVRATLANVAAYVESTLGDLAPLDTVGTAQIDDSAVTLAKIQDIATDSLLGRDTAGSGVVEQIAVTSGISFTGTGSIQWDGVTARHNSGADVGTRRRINLIDGAGVSITVTDDAGDGELDVTVASTVTQYTDEQAQDAVGAILLDSTTIDFTYDDATPNITAAVIDDSISNAKLRNSGALSVIGRSANSSGDPADISATASTDAVFRESGGVLGFGTIATAGIADAAVTRAKLSDGTALSVIGRSANSAGVTADIAASAASDAVLRESGSVLGFGTIATGGIANDAVTYAKIQNVNTDRLLGRDTAGSGDVEELTVGTGLAFTGAGGIECTITQYTDEMAQDAVGGALVDSATINFTYNDGANTITAGIIAAGVVSAINALLDHGTLAGLSDDDHTQYLLANGTRALTADWDAGSFEIRAQTFESDVATGTAPLTIASTTLVTNLNADLLDGQHGSYYTDATNLVNVPTDRLLGRDTAGTGAVEMLTVGSGISFSGSGGITWDGVTVRKNTGADVGTRRRLNLIEGTNVTLTVTDDGAGGEVDITIASTGGGVTDHGALTGLADDDHTQYLLLAGRAGGQTAYGGTAASENLNLIATAHATRGYITLDGLRNKLAAGDTLWVDAANTNVYIGSSNPGNLGTSSGADNVGIGTNALGAATTSAKVVAIGTDAGAAILSSASGTFIGYAALRTDTDSDESVVIGAYAGYQATTASYATLVGSQTAPYAGTQSTFVGAYAGKGATAATTGTTYVGALIANTNTTASDYATAVGAYALYDANGATGTTALGAYAGQNVTTSAYSLILGYDAANTLTTGNGNLVASAGNGTLGNVPAANSANYLILAAAESIAVVDPTLTSVYIGSSKPGNWLTSSGVDNVGMGHNALGSATTANNVVALGTNAGAVVSTSVGGGIFIGSSAGGNDTDPEDSTVVGVGAGYAASTLSLTTLLGRRAAPYGGTSTTIIGAYAGYGATSAASGTTYVGAQIADTNTTVSNYASAFGAAALKDANGATGTSAFGYQAGQNVTTGAYNVLAGHNVAPTLVTGSNNIVIGAYEDTSVYADVASATLDGQIVIATEGQGEVSRVPVHIVVMPLQAGGGATDGNTIIGSLSGNWRAGLVAGGGDSNVIYGPGNANALTSGSTNLVFGYGNASTLTTGAHNLFVGEGRPSPAAGTTYHMDIGGVLFGDLSGFKARFGGSGVVSQTERVAITQATADTSQVLSLETTGSNGAKNEIFVGTQQPSAVVTADPGALYMRVNVGSSSLWVNQGEASGTVWNDLCSDIHRTVSADSTIKSGRSRVVAGPYTVNSGCVLTIESDAVLKVA